MSLSIVQHSWADNIWWFLPSLPGGTREFLLLSLASIPAEIWGAGRKGVSEAHV